MSTGGALTALKKGMSTEIWGQRFYQEAVARTESEQGKRVFRSLVAEGTSPREVAKMLAPAARITKREVYARAQAIREES